MSGKRQNFLGTVLVLLMISGCWHRAGIGCGAQPTWAAGTPQEMPVLIGALRVEPGVLQYEVSLRERNHASKLFVYVPEHQAAKKVRCILIGPAGTHLIDGAEWGAKDEAANEHLPYVRAGYAVVVYSLDGELPDHPTDKQLVAAVTAFKAAESGVANARAALDFALARVPNIDSKRIYTAGHSSAATLALLVAEHDSRIKACIAYAPVCNLPRRLGEHDLAILERLIPGYRDYVQRTSPDASLDTLRCPVFLFHADDDTNVPTAEVAEFAAALKKTNPQVKFVRVPTGNHYASMNRQGIPLAIRWLAGLSGSERTP